VVLPEPVHFFRSNLENRKVFHVTDWHSPAPLQASCAVAVAELSLEGLLRAAMYSSIFSLQNAERLPPPASRNAFTLASRM
jgi:hypothetical protein